MIRQPEHAAVLTILQSCCDHGVGVPPHGRLVVGAVWFAKGVSRSAILSWHALPCHSWNPKEHRDHVLELAWQCWRLHIIVRVLCTLRLYGCRCNSRRYKTASSTQGVLFAVHHHRALALANAAIGRSFHWAYWEVVPPVGPICIGMRSRNDSSSAAATAQQQQ
jgi:hypothetical protein